MESPQRERRQAEVDAAWRLLEDRLVGDALERLTALRLESDLAEPLRLGPLPPDPLARRAQPLAAGSSFDAARCAGPACSGASVRTGASALLSGSARAAGPSRFSFGSDGDAETAVDDDAEMVAARECAAVDRWAAAALSLP